MISVTGSFQIQRAHLQNNKKKEETCGTKPPFRRNVAASAADPRDTEIAQSYLNRYSNPRSRMLAAALGSPIKKRKPSNMKRSTMGLHRRLSSPEMK